MYLLVLYTELTHVIHIVCTQLSLMYKNTMNKHLHTTKRRALELSPTTPRIHIHSQLPRPESVSCTASPPPLAARPIPQFDPHTHTHTFILTNTHTCSPVRIPRAGPHMQEEAFGPVTGKVDAHLKGMVSNSRLSETAIHAWPKLLCCWKLLEAQREHTATAAFVVVVVVTIPLLCVVVHGTCSNTFLCSVPVVCIWDETSGDEGRRWLLQCDTAIGGQSQGTHDPLLLVPLVR